MPEYSKLAINDLDSFIYGSCPHPIILGNGMVIGGGTVYPELNFTLPNMTIDAKSMPEVLREYTQMITEAGSVRSNSTHPDWLLNLNFYLTLL